MCTVPSFCNLPYALPGTSLVGPACEEEEPEEEAEEEAEDAKSRLSSSFLLPSSSLLSCQNEFSNMRRWEAADPALEVVVAVRFREGCNTPKYKLVLDTSRIDTRKNQPYRKECKNMKEPVVAWGVE